MNLDGVNFWNTNHHLMSMWDYMGRIGPFPIMIDDKVRINKEFTIYFQDDSSEVRSFLQRQHDLKHEAYMRILVQERKTHQEMYNIVLQVILNDLRYSEYNSLNLEPIDVFASYFCINIEDATVYD